MGVAEPLGMSDGLEFTVAATTQKRRVTKILPDITRVFVRHRDYIGPCGNRNPFLGGQLQTAINIDQRWEESISAAQTYARELLEVFAWRAGVLVIIISRD